ncbi:MAG: FAD binding domain-containing protein [Conexivisphaera sp.]
MRPRSEYEVLRPRSLEDALEELYKRRGKGDVRVVAGATDVSVQLRSGAVAERELMDISGLRNLRYVREVDDGIEIGALATFSDIARSEVVRSSAPLLARAALSVGSPQIRNLATLAGNLCTASPAGDGIPPLLVLGAAVRLSSSKGTREIPVEEFIIGPHRTARGEDELLTSVRVNRQPQGYRWFLEKLGLRSANAVSVASVSGLVMLDADGRTVEDARIALGAVAPTAIRARRAEEVLRGRKLDEDTMWDAAEAAAAESSPITDVRGSAAYRRMAVAGLLYRALAGVVG